MRPRERSGERVVLQVPAPFDYERATSVEHAIALLEELGPSARLLAGRPLAAADDEAAARRPRLRDRHRSRSRPSSATSARRTARSAIGAMTRHRDLLESDLLARRLAIFTDAERVIADPVVRNRGTIGGALCQADPSEDLSAVCAAVGARMVIRGARGRARHRHGRVPPRAVRDGGRAGRDARRDPRPAAPRASGSAYEKVDRRVGDWAVVAAGAAVELARRHDRARPASRSPRSAATSPRREAEAALAGRGAVGRGVRARRRRSRPRRARRCPTSAARRSTSGTSPAC